MTTTSAPLDRDAIQRKTLMTLWVGAIASRGAVSASFPVAVSAIKELLGDERWAGISTAASTVGSALAAVVLASLMRRHGRRLGIVGGFAVAALGAALGVVAIEGGLLWLFIAAMILVGVGSGTSNLSRYAAADLAHDERRSRDISTVIFAATFGAVLAPMALGFTARAAESAGLVDNSGGFILAIALFAIGSVVTLIALRPDPLQTAKALGLNKDTMSTPKRPLKESLRLVWRTPKARLAMIALVVSQAVMVMVMAMTPLHMEGHDHGKGTVGLVIAAHTAGMFAFAPIAGWTSDRFGRMNTIAVAGAILIAATTLTALATDAPSSLMFPGLYLLGLGWSFGIVAGSALLTESVEVEERVSAQGAADMATNVASGVGALSSGLILDVLGFGALSLVGMFAAGLLVLTVATQRRMQAAG